MKILFIWHAAADPNNRSILSEALAYPGIDITVVATRVLEDRLSNWRLDRTIVERNRRTGSVMRVVPALAILPRSLGYHFHPGLPRLIKSTAPDIIHVHEEAASLSAVEAAFWRRLLAPQARLVIHPYQNVRVDYRWPWPPLERFVLAAADAAVAGNPGAARVLAGRGFRRPVYTLRTLGAHAHEFTARRGGQLRTSIKKGMPIIGFSGRIFSGKGLHILLPAMALMKHRAQLLVAGEGPKLPEARALAVKLGIADRVTWAGRINPGRMADLYSSMDIFAAPTIDRPADMPDWREQSPRAHIEAMLSGLPIVASNGGENAWTVGSAGIVVRQGDPRGLAKALDRLCASPSLRRKLGNRARARATANFTWKVAARGLVSIWGKIMEGRKGRVIRG